MRLNQLRGGYRWLKEPLLTILNTVQQCKSNYVLSDIHKWSGWSGIIMSSCCLKQWLYCTGPLFLSGDPLCFQWPGEVFVTRGFLFDEKLLLAELLFPLRGQSNTASHVWGLKFRCCFLLSSPAAVLLWRYKSQNLKWEEELCFLLFEKERGKKKV